MNATLRNALGAAALLAAASASAEITFYEQPSFGGRSFTTDRQVGNFERNGFNDRASSVIVRRDVWEVCEDARFNGRCMVLRPGQYPSLAAMGLNDRVSSVREIKKSARIPQDRYAPAPVAVYDYGRRRNERLYEAPVTAVRAVVGPPEQRCWVEREQVVQNQSSANVPGAIAGAVIGGILGHQVGGGRGQDIATAGGAVAGAAIGSNVGRSGGSTVVTQDVQKCRTVASGPPSYYDVTYNFRGLTHRVQLATPPGPTVTVNGDGEPRAA